MHDPDLQNITAVKKGYVYPINDMHIMSYSSWMYYEIGTDVENGCMAIGRIRIM